MCIFPITKFCALIPILAQVEFVFALIKDIFKFRVRNYLWLNLKHCQNLWLEVECEGSNLTEAVVYRHPNQDLLSFQDKLCEKLNNLK